jgi:alpha-beta hydrolase superfamily lysophospholipase
MSEGYSMKLVLGLLLLAGLIYFLSFAGINELLTPVRIDSVYVKAQEADYIKQQENTDNKIRPHFFLNPADLHLCYTDIAIHTADSLLLKGWYIPSDNYNNSTLVLILHDLNESRITSLETAKQFSDRGYSVCLFDLRAHGASEGKQFTFGFLEKYDVQTIVDTLLNQYGSKNIALLGIGTGGAIALEAARLDARIKMVIAQSPFNNLYTFVKTYSSQKWSLLNSFLFPLFKKQLEKELLFPLETIDIVASVRNTSLPVLFIAGANDDVVNKDDTHKIFEACPSVKKQFWLVKNATHTSIEENAGEAYYNKISVYIINNSPRKIAKTRYKKFV